MANDYEDYERAELEHYERAELQENEIEKLRAIEKAIKEFIEKNNSSLVFYYGNDVSFIELENALNK